MLRLTKIGNGKLSVPFTSAFIAAFMMIFASGAFASVDVTATVDRNVMDPGDTVNLSVSIMSTEAVAIGQPELPPLSDFEVLNQWTGQETRASLVTTPQGPQFQTVRTSRFNYVLQPMREGVLSIGAVEVVVEGKVYYTKPISIRVAQGAGGQAPSRQGQPPAGIQMPPGFEDDDESDPFSQLLRRGSPFGAGSRSLPINPNDAFFIQVEADKTEAFVGEQITVSWYLYTRGQIRDLDTLKYPALKGFWKEDIEIATHLNFTQEVVNGIPYKKALLASFALFPIKEGTAVIDSYTAKCSVIPSLDSFGGAFGYGKAYTFTKSSQPVKVHVKPLPVEERPADFTGAVGQFQVSARVEDRVVVANQPLTFKFRVEGKGNAKLIDVPPFETPEGMELYDTQNEAKFFRTGTSFKEFSIFLIPRREGEFTVPSISVSMFDPELKKYVTKSTEPVTIHVGKGQGPGGQGPSVNMTDSTRKIKEVPYEPQILLEREDGLQLTQTQRTVGFSGLFGLVMLTLLWRARTELGWGQRKKDLMRRLKTRLRRVDKKVASGDWRGVGTEMTNIVYFVLGEISGQGGASVELEKLLMKAPPSVRRELAEPLQKQVEIFQTLSFAPESVVGRYKEPQELKKAVNEMTQLMERAVALGLSFEQSGESE